MNRHAAAQNVAIIVRTQEWKYRMANRPLADREMRSRVTTIGSAAGWSYRSNQQGWMIYRDPQTGLWHTRTEALGIFERGLEQD